MTYQDTQLLIDNVWRDATGGKSLAVVNPATGAEIGRVAPAAQVDLDAALAAAQRGFELWRNTPAVERARLMHAAAQLLRERVEPIATLMTLEQGKPLAESRVEVLSGADTLDYLAEDGRRIYGTLCRRVP